MISTGTVLAPLLLEVALTFGLLFWLAALRFQALRGRSVRPAEVSLRQPSWPARTLQVGNAFQNQLELPVLFYLLVVLMLLTATATPFLVGLAWLFAISRLLHALIHVTTNDLARRGMMFGAGALVLFLMWIVFAIGIFAG